MDPNNPDSKGTEHSQGVAVPPIMKTPDEDFQRLRDECLAVGRLYEDPDFPAADSSLYKEKKEREGGNIEWRRPKELCDDPNFFSDGPTRLDAVQGDHLTNCWFVAAVAPLTLNNKALHRVVPKDQSFKENYAGIFHFRFWQYGHWVTVIVDDRLPTHKGKLIFMTSRQSDEFWSALLEKAYAKLNGSYQATAWGSTGEGLEDLTGGLWETFKINKLREKPTKLFRRMLQAQKRGSLMGCMLNKVDGEAKPIDGMGIIYRHAYSITCVKYIKAGTTKDIEKMRMIRVRNPWGSAKEWDGEWGDKSAKWDKVSEEIKKKLDFKIQGDGEYWMTIEDFCKHFDDIDINHQNLETGEDFITENKWEMSQFHGNWVEGVSAGGSYIDAFHTNPQYRITLHEHDDAVEGDEDNKGEEDTYTDGRHTCTVIGSLIQKNRRKSGKDNLAIAFWIYQIPDPENTPEYLEKSFFEENDPLELSNYTKLRTATLRFELAPGTYCVVPTTSEPGEEGDFLLRILSEKCHTTNNHVEQAY